MSSSEIPFKHAPRGTTATTQLILDRSSVRDQYQERDVPNEVVEEIILCGLAAPSSKNARPWRLHVVTDRALLCAIADAAATADGAETYVPREILRTPISRNYEAYEYAISLLPVEKRDAVQLAQETSGTQDQDKLVLIKNWREGLGGEGKGSTLGEAVGRQRGGGEDEHEQLGDDEGAGGHTMRAGD